ncbi:MAG TPA: hypothetical protein VG097_15145, partial [Gemmata sp.]|nr:hypothetical protein [Gemmata sp.]
GTDLHIPVFEVVTGKLLYTMQRTNGGVHSAAMSLDGRLMVAGTGDSLYLWEIATGQKRLVVKDSSYLTDVALSPNGRVLAVINNGRVSTVSGEGRTEHTQDRKAIRLLDAFSGKELHKFQGHMGSVNSIAWTLDGKRLLSGCADSTSLIWEVPSWIYLPPKNQPVKLPKPDELWEQLGSSDCEKAWQAIGNLVQLPDTARALIGEKIKPVAAPDAKRVQKWIADLDSEEFSEREKATRELRLLGDAAEPFLRSALAGTPSEEARTRLDGILSRSSGNRIVTGRCLEVLERIGDDPSLKLLTEYAHGAKKCWLTNEAEAAIKRLDQR